MKTRKIAELKEVGMDNQWFRVMQDICTGTSFPLIGWSSSSQFVETPGASCLGKLQYSISISVIWLMYESDVHCKVKTFDYRKVERSHHKNNHDQDNHTGARTLGVLQL
ncbi:uncharacterized protein LOC103709090 isoform X2 [Phoenix dactylifera]|uniref:Uncharacterized protein LOC103709090 isoform X2 n=1 Tax=Phoenix dactylifera TaxID=42345 RepID=A0A8B9AC38_PHODC|nr:uncharacterized protein LOC103709090 isoform X2 [Phoenix dactylifera]